MIKPHVLDSKRKKEEFFILPVHLDPLSKVHLLSPHLINRTISLIINI